MSTTGRIPKIAAPVVVLVHGAWADGSSWRDVIARLQKRKLTVVAAQNPLLSFAADVDAVARTIERQRGRVVLVGHGYGGSVITQAGNDPRVAGLVYVAGFAPDAGESTQDVQKSQRRAGYLDRIELDSGGFAYLPEAAFIEYVAHDLPEVEGKLLAATQVPLHATALEGKVQTAAWRTKPVWYLVTGQDRLISPQLQRLFVRRMRATMVSVHSGHIPLLSDPVATTAIIADAVEAARAESH